MTMPSRWAQSGAIPPSALALHDLTRALLDPSLQSRTDSRKRCGDRPRKVSTSHGSNAILTSMIGETASIQWPVPDPRKCRTMHLGQTLAFSSCVTEDPTGCAYALRFASCVFCCHPERRRFEKTPAHLSLHESILHIGFCGISSTRIDNTASHQPPVPHRGKCRTMYLGPALDLSKCLVENPDLCRSALDFGFGVYCSHPDRRSFEKAGPS